MNLRPPGLKLSPLLSRPPRASPASVRETSGRWLSRYSSAAQAAMKPRPRPLLRLARLAPGSGGDRGREFARGGDQLPFVEAPDLKRQTGVGEGGELVGEAVVGGL